ncbi:MAG: PilZ domain-containing protein [Phycisphaerales bacterium]|nr:PilZ domain-containing protein [Phycisphaerales bacterium]
MNGQDLRHEGHRMSIVATRTDRRQHQRFTLQPMYSPVAVTIAEEGGCDGTMIELDGHAYDISEGGMRMELDEPIGVGVVADVRVALPGLSEPVRVTGVVVWENDALDDPGPRRMAVQFTEFLEDADHDRLVRYLSEGWLRQAA